MKLFNKDSKTQEIKKNKEKNSLLNRKKPSVQESTGLIKFLNWLIKIAVHLLVFLLPLYFLPTTASPLESNKLSLLVILTGIAGVAWMGRMVSQNDLQIKKSFLSIPIIIFAAAYILSSVFSIYRENSIWGYFGGESLSLVALFFFVLLFYIISNNFGSKRAAYYLVLNFLCSSSLVFLFAFLQMIGVNVFESVNVMGTGFNTVGTIYALSAYAGALLLFAIAIVTEKVAGFMIKPIAFITALLALSVITLVNFKLVWLVLVLTMAILMVVGVLRNTKERSSLFIIPTLIFIYCLFGFFVKKPFVVVSDLPSEILPTVTTTLKMTKKIFKEHFLFGVGPGNFSYVFAKFKEPMGNLSSINFNQGVSYFTTMLATSGLLVVLSYLFLVLIMGRYAGKTVYGTFFGKKILENSVSKVDGGERMITPASLFWFFITIMLFLTNANMTLMFAWWFAFAILDALSSRGEVVKVETGTSRAVTLAQKIGMKGSADNTEEISKVSLVISLMFVGIITGFIAVVYILSQKHLASYYYQKALTQAGQEEFNAEAIGNNLGKSIYYNQSRDIYYSALSDVFLLVARQRIDEKNQAGETLTDEDQAFVWGAVSRGIETANSAILVNKSNYNNYLKLGSIYQSIIGYVNGADQSALENYDKAIALSPADPFSYNQKARVYLARYDMEVIRAAEENEGNLTEIPDSAKENLKMAENNINQALAVNPNDQTARLMLVSISELKGDLAQAIKLSEENLQLFQGDFNLAFGLSILYYKNRDYPKAKELLEAMVARWDNYSDARYILGLCYAQEGKLDKSKEQFNKVLELNPDNEEVKQILDDLSAGRTGFLKETDQNKVEEVQQKLESEQQQNAEEGRTILNTESQPAPEEETTKSTPADRQSEPAAPAGE